MSNSVGQYPGAAISDNADRAWPSLVRSASAGLRPSLITSLVCPGPLISSFYFQLFTLPLICNCPRLSLCPDKRNLSDISSPGLSHSPPANSDLYIIRLPFINHKNIIEATIFICNDGYSEVRWPK